MVPVVDIGLEVALEALEVAPVASPEELVLDVPEDLFGRAVVDAAALARHALREAVPPELRDVGRVPVPPAHVGVQDRRRALGLGGHEHGEHLLLLGEVRMLRDRPGHDLPAAEVVGRREVGLAEPALELGDVGAHLLPGPVGGEVAAGHALEGLADGAPVGAVPVMVRLASDAAAQSHLVHHPGHGLAGDACPARRAQLPGCIQSSKSRQFALSISYTSPRACLRP